MKFYLLLLFFILLFFKNSLGISVINHKDSLPSYDTLSKDFGKTAFALLQDHHYDSALNYFYKALKTFAVQENPEQKAYILNNIGVIYSYKGNIDSCSFFYNEAKYLYLKIKDYKKAAYCDINLGIFNKRKAYYDQALSYLLSAAALLEKTHPDLALSSCYNTIATIFSKKKDYVNSLFYYRKSLTIREQFKVDQEIAASYNNIGIIYRKLNLPDSALTYYFKALSIKERYKNYESTAATLNNIGLVNLQKNNLSLAEKYFQRSLKITNSETGREGDAITLNNLGKLYFNQGDYLKSIHYLNKADEIIHQNSLLEELRNNLEIKVQVLEKMNEDKEAIVAYKTLLQINDSILNKEKIQSINELQAKFEADKRLQQINDLEQRQLIQQAELKINQYWITGLAIVILFATAIVILTILLFKREKSNKRKVEILMQELHHRIKNNLQLLSGIFRLQARVVHDKIALEAVRSGENRVNAMSLIHQKLYSKAGSRKMALKEYISTLMEDLAEAYGYKLNAENILLDVEDLELDIDKVIPLGLIVNELASNSFKYAFPNVDHPVLSVKLHRKKKDIILDFYDNGKGFTTDAEHGTSMGLKIINTLSRQLQAKSEWITAGQTKFYMQMSIM